MAFQIVSCLLAFLAAALLLWVNQERRHSNRLLAFILLIFAFQNLALLLLFSRLMLKAPWLLRAFAPTTFIVAPLVFLYIRSVLQDEIKFKKRDWLLFIPALLTLINFIPFYLLPAHEKIDYLNKSFYQKIQTQDSGRGYLPTPVYYIIRVCWSVIFIWIGFRLIARFKKTNPPDVLIKNKHLLNWLFTFNCLLTAVWLVTVLKVMIPVLKNTPLVVADILLAVTILFICLQLFVRPQILYGIFSPLPVMDDYRPTDTAPAVLLPSPNSTQAIGYGLEDNAEKLTTNLNIEPADQLRYKKLVEQHFLENKPFLQTDYSLEHLVRDIKIPRYILSAFINREYGMGFREFLNRYRVEYLIANLDKPSWKQFTLQAIAAECGFSSRITFSNNFKQITGQSPSEYIKAMQQQNLPKG